MPLGSYTYQASFGPMISPLLQLCFFRFKEAGVDSSESHFGVLRSCASNCQRPTIRDFPIVCGMCVGFIQYKSTFKWSAICNRNVILENNVDCDLIC